MNLVLLNYNNYFNRKLKRIELTDIDLTTAYTIKNVSFNPNDYCVTTQVTSTSYSNDCDYAVLLKHNSQNDYVGWSMNATTAIKQVGKVKMVGNFRDLIGLTLKQASAIVNYLKDNPQITDDKADFKATLLISLEKTTALTDADKADGKQIIEAYPFDPTADYSSYPYLGIYSKVSGSIESRWFIVDSVRLRTNQYQLTLKRDLLADYLTEIRESPVFINKGFLPQSDPMICNSEGMSFNQIKVKEQLLKDGRLNSAWIVGYLSKEELVKGDQIIDKIQVNSNTIKGNFPTVATTASKLGITSDQLSTILANKFFKSFTDNLNIRFGVRSPREYNKTLYTNVNFKAYDFSIDKAAYDGLVNNKPSEALINVLDIDSDYYRIVSSSFSDLSVAEFVKSCFVDDYFPYSIYQKLINLDGINYGGKNYRFKNITIKNISKIGQTVDKTNSYLNPILTNIVTETGGSFTSSDSAKINISLEKPCDIRFELEEVVDNVYTIPLANTSSRRHCSGSVCDIFAIPLNSINVGVNTRGGPEFKSSISREDILKIASELATELSSYLYDIQLLPYCPIPTAFWKSSFLDPGVYTVTTANLTAGSDYDYITYTKDSAVTKASIIYWLNSNDYQLTIPVNLTVKDRKIESQTDMLRICSPTGQGLFDMNLAKNDGLDFITVNMTYKPYNPYIQLLPNFKGLYGSNFNDYRGLICGGDYSLSRISDAWVNYQLNNKNFENIFNREMQSLDISQDYERQNQLLSVLTGATTAGVQSGAIGSLLGLSNPVTAGLGVGLGIASGVAGLIDYRNSEKLRAEQKDLAIDKFNYQLGNIQAIPLSVTKVSSFIINSKLFPFLEFYSCSSQETEALTNKIKYNGMTVNRIGTLGEMESEDNSHFFQGDLIILEGVNSSTNLLNNIYEEIRKGVYI